MPIWDRRAAINRTLVDRRRAAQRKVGFKSLITSPQVLTGGIAPAISSALALPNGAYLGLSYSVAVTSGQLQANTNGGRTLGTPDLDADEIHRIGWFERGFSMDLEITAAVAGTATLHYLDEWRNSFPIATAVFT
jgi:hypothetical protein